MVSLAELAEKFDLEVRGDPAAQVDSVATIQSATKAQIAFLANKRYRKYLGSTHAGAVVLGPADADHCSIPALVSDNPYLAFAKISTLLNPAPQPVPGIHKSALVAEGCDIGEGVEVCANVVIERGVKLGKGVYVGPGCVIGEGVEIGDFSRLAANVTLYHDVRLGQRVLIHSSSVIGADGFGFAGDNGEWFKVPQLGSVIIGDDVEIGASTTIDRGALDDTVIGNGVKLDNQIQVAHNVRIGDRTAIAGCTGIAGSTIIGKRCQIGGAVCVVGHLTIVDDVYITASTLVSGSIRKPGLYSSGTPVEPNKQWQKNAARFRKLDTMAQRLKAVEREVFK